MTREHPPETREILRRAGLSERAELTDGELRRVRAAKFALAENPAMTKDSIYRTIFPRQDDPDD